MKAIKLNFRHSLKSMNAQLERHDELAIGFWYDGNPVYEVVKCAFAWGKMNEGVLFCCSKKSDLADYINKKNGFN